MGAGNESLRAGDGSYLHGLAIPKPTYLKKLPHHEIMGAEKASKETKRQSGILQKQGSTEISTRSSPVRTGL